MSDFPQGIKAASLTRTMIPPRAGAKNQGRRRDRRPSLSNLGLVHILSKRTIATYSPILWKSPSTTDWPLHRKSMVSISTTTSSTGSTLGAESVTSWPRNSVRAGVSARTSKRFFVAAYSTYLTHSSPLGLGNAPGLDMSGMADFGGDFHFDEGQNQFDLSLNAVAGNSASHSSPSMRNGVGGNSKLSGVLFNLRHKLQTGQAHASEGSIVLPLAPLSPVLDLDEQALADGQIRPERKTKRVRLLLDSRTELTNEELEVRIFDFLCC